MGDSGYQKEMGRRGEEAAAAYLEKHGFKIVSRNFKGPSGEIDLIARDQETLVFIEVKGRSSLKFGTPRDAVTPLKQERLFSTADYYLSKYYPLHQPFCRFDIVEVSFYRGEVIGIQSLKDAFQRS